MRELAEAESSLMRNFVGNNGLNTEVTIKRLDYVEVRKRGKCLSNCCFGFVLSGKNQETFGTDN